MAKTGRVFTQVRLQDMDTGGQGKAGRVFTQVRLQDMDTEVLETNAQGMKRKSKQSSQHELQSRSKTLQEK